MLFSPGQIVYGYFATLKLRQAITISRIMVLPGYIANNNRAGEPIP